MKINYYCLTCFALLSFSRLINAQVTVSNSSGGNSRAGYKTNWTVNPFDYKIFVENKGQFSADIQNGDKILYGAQMGDIYAFITNKGIIYRYTEFPGGHPSADRRHSRLADPDDIDPKAKPIQHYLRAIWFGANSAVSTVADEEQTYYCTYPAAKKGTISANAFKKITCRNVYPGIDVEY